MRNAHLLAGLMIAIVVLAGCATKTSKPEAKASVETANINNEPLKKMIQKAAAEPTAVLEGAGWKPLFNGRTLAGWRETDFSGHGPVRCEAGLMVIEMGSALSGVNWTNELPKVDYEIALDAMRLDGSDFFCGLTFPVKDSHCSLILGGWGGGVVGLSSINGSDASENETTQYMRIETGHWYRVRVRVTAAKIEVWLDEKKIVNLDIADKKISLRYGEIEFSKPLGVATYQTTAALREIKLRRL